MSWDRNSEEDSKFMISIPTDSDIRRLNEQVSNLRANIDGVLTILARIEDDRKNRPDVYRRGSSGAARIDELIARKDSMMYDIQRIVEKFKKKYALYLQLKEMLPIACSIGAVGACAYTGNIFLALKIIGGAFTLVTTLVVASVLDTSMPLSQDDRLWFTDFFTFYTNRVRPKLD